MKYAIYGGSFDPPHLGHSEVAQTVLEHFGLDEVVFVPANRNPLKGRARASAEDRMAMVNLLTSRNENFTLSDIEINRPGRSYSVDTMEEFSVARPGELWLIMGSETLASIMSWKNPEKLVKFCRFAVVERPGADVSKVLGNLPDWIVDKVDIVQMKPNRISSTLIRDEIARGESPEMWLDPKVWEYMCERGLYR